MNKRMVVVMSAVVMATVLSLATGSARGHGFRRGPGGRGGFAADPGMGPGPRGGGLVLRLLFPCRSNCFDAARECVQGAEAEVLACAASTCAGQITAGQEACAGGLNTDDCRTARDALVACLGPCLDAKRTALTSCHTTAETCADTCAE